MKEVRFASTEAGLITGVSRELNETEAWSLYNFEQHAKGCRICWDACRSDSRTMVQDCCAEGNGLANDVLLHVWLRSHDEQIYSTQRDSKLRHVRVEVGPKYINLRRLLKSAARARRHSPIVTYEDSHRYEVRPHTRADSLSPRRETVIIEPASSKTRRYHEKASHTSTHYPKTVRVTRDDDDIVDSTGWSPSQARRQPAGELLIIKDGSRYEQDGERRRERYRTEIREPSKPAATTRISPSRQSDHRYERRREERSSIYYV
jgi:hypothetical protein